MCITAGGLLDGVLAADILDQSWSITERLGATSAQLSFCILAPGEDLASTLDDCNHMHATGR